MNLLIRNIFTVFLVSFCCSNYGKADDLEILVNKSEQFLEENRFDSSLVYAKQAEIIGLTVMNREMAKQAQSLVLINCDNLYLPSQMITTAKRYLILAKSMQDTAAVSKALNYFGKGYYWLADHGKAYEYFYESLMVANKLSDPQLQSTAINNMALLHLENGEFDQSRKLFQSSLNLSTQDSSAYKIGLQYNNIGESYYLEGDMLAALNWYIKADSVLQSDSSITDNFSLNIQLNMAGAYFALGQVKAAETIYLETLPQHIAIGNHQGELVSYSGLTEIYREADPIKERYYLDLMYEKSGEYEIIQGQISALYSLKYYSVQNKNFEKAYTYSEELAVLNDSIQRVDIDATIEKINLKNNLENRKKKIREPENKQKILELNEALYLLGVCGIILILLFIILYFRKVIRKNKAIAAAKSEIDAQKIEAQQVALERNKEKLNGYINLLIAKNQLTAELQQQTQEKNEDLSAILSLKIITKEDWQEFKKRYEVVFPTFIFQLREKHPNLTEAEQRLFILKKINLSTDDIANVLGISADSVRKTRLRLRKALGLASNNELDNYILKFAS